MNFLVIMSDEHRRDAMGCMGHNIVKTPNLDALAAAGTLFENAYTPSPMCVPARASLACGKYVHQIGHWDSASPYDGEQKSWMHELRNAGVDVTAIGKLHFRSTKDDNGFNQEILPMHVNGGIGWTIGLLRENLPYYGAAAELAADVGAGQSSYTHYDLAIANATERYFEELVQRDQPWSAFVSFVSPHYPLTAPQEYYDLYDQVSIDMPVGHPSTEKPRHPELNNLRGFFNYDDYFDEEKIRAARVAYYGLTSFLDDSIGRVLSALEASGQAQDTLVIYVSDHGDMMGDQGYWTKMNMFEASAGVPMIVKGPGIPIGKRIATAVSLLDLAPTALQAANISDPRYLENLPGASLIELARAEDDLQRTVLSEYHDGGSTTGSFMVRWAEWKFVYFVGMPSQLFNLALDPNELVDLLESSDRSPDVLSAEREGLKRLFEICDPQAVNSRCFADQQVKIEALGGEKACESLASFNHTPTPTPTSTPADDQ